MRRVLSASPRHVRLQRCAALRRCPRRLDSPERRGQAATTRTYPLAHVSGQAWPQDEARRGKESLSAGSPTRSEVINAATASGAGDQMSGMRLLSTPSQYVGFDQIQSQRTAGANAVGVRHLAAALGGGAKGQTAKFVSSAAATVRLIKIPNKQRALAYTDGPALPRRSV